MLHKIIKEILWYIISTILFALGKMATSRAYRSGV